MKRSTYFLLRLIILMVTAAAGLSSARAQCGSVSGYMPSVSSALVCSGNSVYVYATGLPVSSWLYRDGAATTWNVVNTTADNYSQFVSITTPTTRTYRAVVNISGCTPDTTLPVTVQLVLPTYGNNNNVKLSSSAYSPCSGSSVTMRIMNQGILPQSWVVRDNGGPWSLYTFSSSTSLSATMPVTTTPITREYRVLFKTNNNSCQQDSSASLVLNIMPAVAGNNPNIRPSQTQQTICGGTSVNLQLTWPYEVGNWIYKDDTSSTWTVFTSGNSSATDNATNIAASSVRAYRVILKNPNTCAADTSDAALININASQRRTLLNVQPKMSTAATICAGTSASFQLTGFSNVSWYYQDSANGAWNLFSTGTSASLSSSSSLITDINRTVKAVLNNGASTCSMDTTAPVTYKIKALVRGNSSTAVPFVANNVVASGAQVQLYLQNGLTVNSWLYRNNNTGSWTSTSSGNTFTDNNTTVTLNTLRSYRAIVNNTATCRLDTTPELQVQIKLPVPGGVIAITPVINAAAYCAASTVSGNITLNNNLAMSKWIYRDNGTGLWLDLPFQTSTFFSDNTTSTITSSTKRSYRAIVRNFETLTLDTSIEASTIINPVSRGTVSNMPATSTPVVCTGTNSSLSVVPPVGYTVSYWMYREPAQTFWSTFGSSQNTPTDFVSTSNASRTYRVLFFNSAQCRYDTSAALTITVNQKLSRNNPSIVPTINSASICGGTTLSMSVTASTGVSAQKWQYSDNGGIWKDVSGSSASTSYFEAAANTRVLSAVTRGYRIILNDNNNCIADTSAATNVAISPYTHGATSGITPGTTSNTICSGTSYSVQLNNYSGTVQKWVYRDNGGNWNEYTNSTASTSLFENNSYVPVNTTREYRAFLPRTGSCIIDTTQILTVQLKPYTSGNANAVQPTASIPAVCSGTTYAVNIASGTGYAINKWIYRDNNSGVWRDIVSSTQSTQYNESNNNALSQTVRSYRAIILTNTCSYDTSAQVNVQLNPRTAGYLGSVAITSSAGVYCSGTSITANIVTATVPGATGVRKWLYRDNGGKWLEIANSNGTFNITHTNTFVTIPTTRSYRAILDNANTCGSDSSGIYSVTINPSGNGYLGSVTPTASVSSVCNGTTTPTLTLGSFSGTIQKWLVNNNNTGWTDFGYPTTTSSVTDYNVNVLVPTSRAYRALVSNTSTCSIDSTNTVSISVNPSATGNLLGTVPTSTRSVLCYSKPASLSVTLPSGYSVSKWIYSDNNGSWTDFTSNTASTSLTDNNTYVPVTTSRAYKAIIINNTLCRVDTTAAFSILINARSSNISNRNVQPTANSSGICSGSSVTLSATPGTGNEIYRWTYSDNGTAGPWIDAYTSYTQFGFAHTNTYALNPTTRLYRAIITDTATCDFDTTMAVAVGITPIRYGTDTSITIVGSDTVCAGATAALTLTPTTGITPQKWIYRENGGSWQSFTSGTSSTSINDALTLYAPGTIKGYTAIVFRTATCSYDTVAKSKNVYIKNKSYGNGTTTVTITVADTVCAGNTVNATTTGTVERWIYSDGNKNNWQAIASSNSTFLSHTNTGVSSSLWRYYRAIISSGACSADSSLTDSVFLRLQSTGSYAITPTTTTPAACAGNALTVSVSISNGTLQRWIARDNGGNWYVLSTTTSTSVTDYNTTVTSGISREYRAIVFRNCSYDTTNSLVVTITPKVYGSDPTKIPTAASTSICTSSAVSNIQVAAGSGNTIMQWLQRDNGGAWTLFASGNQNNLTDYNTYVGTTVTRNYVAIINNNTTCRYDTSAMLTVTINPVVMGNSSRTVTAPATTCMGNSYNVSMSVATDTSVIRFLYNYGSGAWNDRGYITPASSSSFSEYGYSSGTPYTMGYRAVLYKAGNCHIDTTAPVYTSINPRSYGNDNSITPTTSSNVCSGASYTVSVSAGTGNTVQYWMYNDNNGPWNLIYNAGSSFSQTAQVSTATVRRYRALIVKANSCSIDTTAPAVININPLVYATDNSIATAISGNKGVCTGNSVSISVNPGPASVSTWLYRDGFSGPWNNMYLASNTITDYNTITSVAFNRQYAVVLYKSATCHMDTTVNNDTANISPRTYGNDNGITISSSQSNVCTGTAINMTVSGIGANTVQLWLYRQNGGAWTTFYNGSLTTLSDNNTQVSAITTREYRVLVRKTSVCSYDTSASFTATIGPRAVGNDNSIVPTVAAASVCSGNTVNINVTPGTGNSVQKWIYRENNGAWTDFSGTSASSVTDYNTVTATLKTRQYRAIILKGSGCTTDTSAAVTATINPIGYGNQNSVAPTASRASVCSGSAVTLSVSGFSGSAVQKWVYRDNATGSWNEFNSSATSITDFGTTTSTAFARQYRAIVVNASGCSFDTTGATTVSVNPITSSVLPTPAQASQPTVCAGNAANVFINPPAGYTLSAWLYRDAGGSWQTLSTGLSASVNDYNTNVSVNTLREYRAILSNAAGCSLDSSSIASVDINLITQGTNLAIVPNTTTPVICSSNTAIIGVSGFSGSVKGWLYRDSVVNGWTPIFSTDFTLLHTNTFVAYARTREYRAIVYNTNTCSNDTTAAVQVSINPQLAGNANNIAPATTTPTLCSGQGISITASGFINGGVVTGWIYRDNNGPWILTGATGSSLNQSSIGVTALTTREFRALVRTGCSTDTTATLSVTIDVYPTKPAVLRNTNSDTLTSSVTGTTYQWRRDGNIITGATSASYIATQNGDYTVEVGNASGCKTLSDAYTYITSGIEEQLLKANTRLYPNPTLNGQVSVEISGVRDRKVKVTIMDMLGKQVGETTQDLQGGSFMLDISKHEPGIYFFTITVDGATITKKIIYGK